MKKKKKRKIYIYTLRKCFLKTHQHIIKTENFLKVNKIYSESYEKSTIPYLQRRQNTYFKKMEEMRRKRGAAGRSRGGVPGWLF